MATSKTKATAMATIPTTTTMKEVDAAHRVDDVEQEDKNEGEQQEQKQD